MLGLSGQRFYRREKSTKIAEWLKIKEKRERYVLVDGRDEDVNASSVRNVMMQNNAR